MLYFEVFGHQDPLDVVQVKSRLTCSFGSKKFTVSGFKRQFDKWYLFRTAPLPPQKGPIAHFLFCTKEGISQVKLLSKGVALYPCIAANWGQKRYHTKKLCDKDLGEFLGELSGAIFGHV